MQKEVGDLNAALERFSALSAEVLLLGRSSSPAYFRVALDSLAFDPLALDPRETIVPHARPIELRGLDHGGAGKPDQGGQPRRPAAKLHAFLSEKNLVFAFFPRVAVDIGQAQRGKETLILRSKITRGPPNPSSLAMEMARSPGESCTFNSLARPNSRHTAKSDCRPSKSPTCSVDRRNR
jgi:hypothetical protein